MTTATFDAVSEVACEECGKFFTPKGMGPHLAKHRRAKTGDPQKGAAARNGRRGESSSPLPGPEPEPLWDATRDLPPRSRTAEPPPSGGPESSSSSTAPPKTDLRYLSGIGFIGVGLAAAGVLKDPWEQQHFRGAAPPVAEQLEKVAKNHPAVKPWLDFFFAAGEGEGGIVFAFVALVFPILAHRGYGLWPGVTPIREPQVPKLFANGPPAGLFTRKKKTPPPTAAPSGVVIGDDATPAPGSIRPEPTPSDPTLLRQSDGPAGGIPPDAIADPGPTDEFGNPAAAA